MEWGAVFPWDCAGIAFHKVRDPEGVTTEFAPRLRWMPGGPGLAAHLAAVTE